MVFVFKKDCSTRAPRSNSFYYPENPQTVFVEVSLGNLYFYGYRNQWLIDSPNDSLCVNITSSLLQDPHCGMKS